VQLDLNLLTALDALLEEESVTGAADRLQLSAPAMSRTLGRIRAVTGDEILVRTGRTMTPTPYAARIRARVHELVAEAGAVLAPERALDLDTLERAFTLQCHDAVTTAIGPHLLRSIRTQAPNVSLRLLPEAASDTSDLKHGRVDLEIAAESPGLPEIRSQILAEDPLVLAMRSGHPLAGPAVTVRAYARAEHVTVSRRGRLRDHIDELLEARGLTRRVVAAAPTTAAALCYVRQSDLITLVPETVCRSTIQALGLATAPAPLPLWPTPIVAAWHQRYDNDRAHQWLRTLVEDAVASLWTPSSLQVARSTVASG
jgi:DNA-binding transcriptional LysR family regulator